MKNELEFEQWRLNQIFEKQTLIDAYRIEIHEKKNLLLEESENIRQLKDLVYEDFVKKDDGS